MLANPFSFRNGKHGRPDTRTPLSANNFLSRWTPSTKSMDTAESIGTDDAEEAGAYLGTLRCIGGTLPYSFPYKQNKTIYKRQYYTRTTSKIYRVPSHRLYQVPGITQEQEGCWNIVVSAQQLKWGRSAFFIGGSRGPNGLTSNLIKNLGNRKRIPLLPQYLQKAWTGGMKAGNAKLENIYVTMTNVTNLLLRVNW